MGVSRISETTGVIIALILVLTACKFAQVVLEPALFAIFLIEIVWPLQKTLQARLGTAAALTITGVLTSAVVIALLSLIVWEGREIAEWIRQNLDRIQESLIRSTSWLEDHDIFLFATLADSFNSATVLRVLQVVAMRINTLLAFALIVIIYVLLGLAEASVLAERIEAWKNQDTSRHILAAGRRIGQKFRKYMVVRTIASIATGLSVWALARLVGLELAAASGVLAFSLNYLPYLGSLIVTALVPLFAFVQFGSIETAAIVLVGVLFVQAAIGSYLEPVFAGTALSISPPLVLFSIVLWTFLWGPLGAFLGVPLAIAAITLFEEFPSTRGIADILSGGRSSAVS